jgi:large subunit ribosomal protein L15
VKLNELRPAAGAHKRKKRVGRGPGGTDKTSGRGHKGQSSRSGSSNAVSGSYKSEGGQTPMIRRLPKRGFNHVGEEFHLVNLSDLAERFKSGATVNAETLVASGLLRKVRYPIKLLGRGELGIALTVTVDAASAAAADKVRAAGGSITVLRAEAAEASSSTEVA